MLPALPPDARLLQLQHLRAVAPALSQSTLSIVQRHLSDREWRKLTSGLGMG